MTTLEHLRNLLPREMFVYHCGYLPLDRIPPPKGSAENPLVQIASTAWQLYEDGKILLVQRKIGLAKDPTFTYDYIAVGREVTQKPKLRVQ